MTQRKKSHKKYREIISSIAKTSLRDPHKNYAIAKSYLKQLHPEWDDVKLESTVLWDVREFFRTPKSR